MRHLMKIELTNSNLLSKPCKVPDARMYMVINLKNKYYYPPIIVVFTRLSLTQDQMYRASNENQT